MVVGESKFRESIWSIHPKWRVWFYVALSICGVAVSAFTLYDEWSEGWLEIFDVLWIRVLGSVVVVWFVFQLTELGMGAYQSVLDYLDYRAARRQAAEEQARKEAEAQIEQARREAEAYQKRYNEELLKQGVTEEQIRQAQQQSSGIGPSFPSMK